MKKSDAILTLKEILNCASGHDAAEIDAEWLLWRIEEDLKMLPPHYNNYRNVDEFGLYETNHEWEPENEKK